MASSSSLTLFLFVLFSLSSLSFSLHLYRPLSSQSNNALHLDIHNLLPLYGFPKGLLPNNVESYTLSDDGHFTVHLTSHCYVNFPGQVVFYDKKFSGKLSYESVKDVQGIQAREFFIWVPITAMKSDPSSDTIVFSVGFAFKTLPASMFEDVPSCSRKSNLEKLVESA